MQEKPLSHQESLAIIQEMVQHTRQNFREDGFLYLMWGWLVFGCALGYYLLLTLTAFPYPYLTWAVMPLAGVYHLVYVARKRRRSRVRTYLDTVMSSLWLSLMVVFFLLLLATPKLSWAMLYPIFMILYGIGSYVSGGVLNFKPLQLGGIATWIIALFAFYLPHDLQILLMGLAVLVSFIIPGHLLKAKHETLYVQRT